MPPLQEREIAFSSPEGGDGEKRSIGRFLLGALLLGTAFLGAIFLMPLIGAGTLAFYALYAVLLGMGAAGGWMVYASDMIQSGVEAVLNWGESFFE